jgi:phosphoribosylcarboxyaminoimidazole (NCAIR) mutase
MFYFAFAQLVEMPMPVPVLPFAITASPRLAAGLASVETLLDNPQWREFRVQFEKIASKRIRFRTVIRIKPVLIRF